MLRVYLLIILITGLSFLSCTSHQVAVTTLDDTIEDAAKAVLDSVNNNTKVIESFTIEISVTQGFKAGATVPIPVVPISIEGNMAVGTKLSLKLDMEQYLIEQESKELKSLLPPSRPQVFMLDTRTGALSDVSSTSQ